MLEIIIVFVSLYVGYLIARKSGDKFFYKD